MNHRWAPALELLPEFVATLARDRTILYINRTRGHSFDQVIGSSLDGFIAPDDQERVAAAIEEVFVTKQAGALDLRSVSNVLFETQLLPLFEEEEVVAVVSIGRDATEQRHAEELLTHRQGLLQALLHAFPDMVFRTTLDGTILDFSGDPGSTYVPPEQFLQRRVADVLPPEIASLILDGMARAIRENELVPVEYQLPRGGEMRYFEARIVRCGTDEVLSIVRDRTHQRQMEQRLMQADRVASLGALAAGVAHEINNPLTYVIGNLTLAARELVALAASQDLAHELHDLQRALADARAGADRVRYIVSDLNAFSAAPRTDLSVVELRKVLDSAINMAWSEIRHRARLVREYDDVPGVLGNEHRLGQVFLNLLVNAAQAIEEGDAQKNSIHVGTKVDNGSVLVSIEDSGRGFDATLSAHMFDPFFTTKPIGEGTGLGLAICRAIVDSLGGTLTAKSEGLGRGACFVVRLPATDEPAEVRPAPKVEPVEGSPEAEPIRGRILVIDDEPVIATMARRALASHEVYVVTSGRDALELCRAQHFDVIICDLLMPDVTGMDLYENLRRQGQGVEERIVFMTAGAFTPRARRFLSQVSNPQLEKPFDIDDSRARRPARPPSLADFSGAVDHQLLGGQIDRGHRSVHVHLRGRDAHLGAKAELAAVVEACRGVPEHARGVDLGEETLGDRGVAGHDRRGVVRSVVGDVIERGVEIVDGPDGEDPLEELRVPVERRGGLRRDAGPRQRLLARPVGPHLHPFGGELNAERTEDVVEAGPMDQQRLHRVAHARALHLGVEGDPLRHPGVSVRVHVDLTDPGAVPDHRHAGVSIDHLHQRLPAARDHQVDPAGGAEQRLDLLTARVEQAHDGILAEAGLREPAPHRGGDRFVAGARLLAAAQDHGVARLDRQRGALRGHVRAGLVDDRDDAERDPPPEHPEARAPHPDLPRAGQRIRELADRSHGTDHRVDPRLGESQAIPERLRELGGGRQISGVRGEDVRSRPIERARDRVQGSVPRLRVEARDRTGRDPRSIEDLVDHAVSPSRSTRSSRCTTASPMVKPRIDGIALLGWPRIRFICSAE